MIRLRGRTGHDALLLAGLTAALLTMFDRTIGFVLQVAAEVEQSYGVRLMPALVVLTAIFVIHLNNKRQESRAEAAATALQAQLALERTQELERLTSFGELLAAALTEDAIRVAVCRFLPEFAGERSARVATRSEAGWDTLVDTATPPFPAASMDSPALDGVVLGGSVVREAGLCLFPLSAGAKTVGLLTVSEGPTPLSPTTERVLTAVASLLAIAIRNVQLFSALHETALTDALTGCFNRAHFTTALDAELRRARRTRAETAIIVIDLDGFKNLNDTSGHLAGDAALAAVSERLRLALRRSDVRCRIGGDEFAIVLPDTHPAGALQVAETLRQKIAGLERVDGQPLGVTASIGVASARLGEDPETLLHRADMAQYCAKRAGGNQVAVSEPQGDRLAPVSDTWCHIAHPALARAVGL
jgi:diguanylate cyclase (GGDEF)-like protein